MTPVAAAPSRVQVTVVAGPPVEIQVSVNIGGSAVGVVWRLNWTGSVIVTSPNYNERECWPTYLNNTHDQVLSI